MSRISEINNQIQSLEDQIKKLKSEKFNINFLNMLDLDEDQIKNELKRISNMKVDVKNSCVSNDMDEYASNTIHELHLKYNYTLVNFISPGEVSGRLCNVELYYGYESNQTYDNRFNPDIGHVLRITMKEPKSNKNIFQFETDDELEVVESDTIMEYDVSEGDWGSIIKILINYNGDVSNWNSFVEDLEK